MNSEIEIRRAIGNRIRIARRKRGFTQAQLAEIVDVSNRLISDLENARKNTSISKLIDISDALNISFEYLMTGMGEESRGVLTLFNRLSARDKEIALKNMEILLKINE